MTKQLTKELERSHLFKISLDSFFKSLASRERYFTGAEYRAKCSSLETSYQRFPPLDYGPEVNPVFLLLFYYNDFFFAFSNAGNAFRHFFFDFYS